MGWVVSAAFSHDGSALLTGSNDGTARLWKKESQECLHVLAGRGYVDAFVGAPIFFKLLSI